MVLFWECLATFAEPAIGVLRAAGSGVDPTLAPLLWTILNTGAETLVYSVGVGVGIAVLLGVLRFYKGWSLKPFIYIGVIVLSLFTLYFQFSDARLQHVLGLAWDCGAVTTGPVTVPLVLALGIGVCRIVSTGGSSNTGFGVVTLASLFPILAVKCYAMYLFTTMITIVLPIQKRNGIRMLVNMVKTTILTFSDSGDVVAKKIGISWRCHR